MPHQFLHDFELRTHASQQRRIRVTKRVPADAFLVQLPSKAPFSKRFEEAVGLACESAAVRPVAR